MSSDVDRLAQLRGLRSRIDAEIAVLEYRLKKRQRTGRRRNGTQPPCGTEDGYQWHRRRREATCPECKRAHAAHERAQVARRRLAGDTQ